MRAPALWILLSVAGLWPAVGFTDPDPVRQQELSTLLYQDCGSCHGMTLGGGLGPALTVERMNAYSAEALAGVILHGVPGTAMPPWKALLSEDDARWLADQLQHHNPLAP